MFNLLIIQPIFNLLLAIYSIIPGSDFGIAIIVFTIIIRFALLPLVKKQLHQTKAMQKMQPELAKIKKACKGNKQLESMQTLELYKKNNINPFRSIIILLIQLPIFIALYQVIQIFTVQRERVGELTYGFLQGLEPVKQIIADPSNFHETFLGFINLTQGAVSANSVNFVLLILVILSSLVQYYLTKQTMPKKQNTKKLRDIFKEAADGKQADQSEMNAAITGLMMKFMPIMMFLIMIGLPSALVLYYLTSNVIAVIQQYFILKDRTEEVIEETPIIQNKKATNKARAKAAREANIIHISAKDKTPNKKKRRKT